MKNHRQFATLFSARVRVFLFLLALCLFFPGIVLAGHKLQDKQCYDCHVVGGSLADAVTNSHLIRKTDSRMSQILANGWITGTTVPCVYCHDTYGRGVRSNMVGVWNDFTTPISKHPVDPYTSNYDAAKEGGDQTSLDCIDCHAMNVVYYVKGGPSPGTTLSPNIHGKDVSSVVSTPGPGLLTAADTWKNWSTAAGVSPYNAQGNTFCTKQCHDGLPGTGVSANQAAHGYTSPLVTLELSTGQLDTTINGCLDEGAGVGGCHSVHKASDNPDLITQKNAVGTTIRRTDCGACHVFDDPPASRSTSDWYSNGHGRFSTSNGITCLSCHDSAIPHFGQDGSANANSPNRLGFAVDPISSGFSSPAKSRLSICTTCHTGYAAHTSPTSPYYPVGCLDCHDPHGYGVAGNLKMMRRVPPIAAPTSTISYANSGDWYNSAQGGSDFTDWSCDNRDCHATIGSISSIMNTTTGTHGGGTGVKSGCGNCHRHTGGKYSWAASCDQCHGGGGSYWPSIVGGDDGGTTPNDAGRHGIHRQALETRLGYAASTTSDSEQKTMCRYCHKVGDTDHTSATRAEVFPAGYAKAIWDTPTQAPSETNASFTAGTNAGTCTNVDCHNNKATAANFAWYASSTSTCTMCHDDVTQATTTTGETHTAHTGNQASYGATIDCNTCHVNGVVWGTTPPPTGHRNGSWTLSFGYPYGTWTGVSYAGSWAAGTRGGCGTNPCHNDGTGGAPARAGYAWGTSMANDCASCHQGAGMATNKHGQHLASNALPGTALTFNATDECVTCHSGTTTGGGVASGASHINAVRDVSFAASFGYEGGAASRINTGAATTCSTVRCHNGVGTPSWSAASVINCGDCHHDLNLASSPRPTWEGSVGRSHAAHADTDGVYTDCANCHTAFSSNYTATGGTNHQNLVVNIAPSGGSYAETLGGAGVDWSSGSDGIDNGTCSAASCHGTPATLPQWGVPGTVECGSCHGKTRAIENRDAWGITPDVQGAPPMTLAGDTNRYKVGKHQNHVDNSGALLGDACALCHSGAGSGSGLHADGKTQVVFDAVAGASATYDSSITPPTCSNLAGSCHGTGQWDSQATGGCDFCHGYPPNSTNNKHAGGVSAVNHDSAAITPNHQECWYCHGMKNDGTNQPSVMATSVLKGSYLYSVIADHRTGSITINGDGNVTAGDDAGYTRSGTTGFCATAACHGGNDGTHVFTVGTGPIQKRDLGPGKCSSCHDTGVGGAPIVTAASTHVDADGAGGTWVAGQCEGCHSGHSGGVKVPLPPILWDNPGTAAAETWNMQTRLGINYTRPGHNGINLGGPGTAAGINTRTTEAEICWGCHGTDTTINEWGLNYDTNGSYPIGTISAWAGSHYNYGSLFSDSAWTTPTADWTGTGGTGAFRKDGYQHDASNGYILSRQIASIHSVSFITTEEVSSVASNVSAAGVVTPGILEARGAIRCSYCHDVHNLNRALNDVSSGRPYLRGTWMGNPYGPDMPPLAAYVYPMTGQVGPPTYNNGNRFTTTLDGSTFPVAVPRLFASHSYTRGGYFIDQNSGWPTKNTAYDTVGETAGLCTLCHGTDVSTMDFYSGSSIWRTVNAGANGHANAALGGAGAADSHASDLFDATRGNSGPTNVWMGQQRSVPLRSSGKTSNYGVSGKYGNPNPNGPFYSSFGEPANSGDQYIPASNSGWYGGTPGTINVGGQYSTWFAVTGIGTNGSPGAIRAHRFTCSKCHSPHATGLPALLITNCLDRSNGKWSGAGGVIGPGGATPGSGSWADKVQSNCHRKDSTTSGWNRLAPAQ